MTLRLLRSLSLVPASAWSLLAAVTLLLAIYLSAGSVFPWFMSWRTAATILDSAATLGLCAIGMTFVILAGGIDLSVGAVLALASLVTAIALQRWGLPAWLAIPLVCAIGATYGAAVGGLVHSARLPSFLVTLAGMFLARGVALLMTSEGRISMNRVPVHLWGSGVRVVGLTLPALVFLATLGMGALVLRWTVFGRGVRAIGGGEHAARLLGIRVARTRVGAFAVCGLCAALAGVVHSVGVGAGDAKAGELMELDAIAGVVIGGTPLSGGVGSIVGTGVGVSILKVIELVIVSDGSLSAQWAKIVGGGLLLLFVLLQRSVGRITKVWAGGRTDLDPHRREAQPVSRAS
ncbi:MAG: sugar ABC transporter permease YjfF [Phycisphaeraceae bacterium]|nr:sugar ABC transporter permease YjfF [Phycisphaeraceae bacterium]